MIANRCIDVYGSVQLEKAYCSKCKTTAFIIDSRLQCCDAEVENTKEYIPVKYISEARNKRKPITLNTKEIILDLQDHKCFYCRRKFNTPYTTKGKNNIKYTTAVIDHVVPFCYCQSTNHNLVAACNLCNSLKSDKIFSDLIQIMIWAREQVDKRYRFL